MVATSQGVVSGTGQFIEPVMSTMKYRSIGIASPSAELVAQAEFESMTAPLPPFGLPVEEPLPVSRLPVPALLLVLIFPVAAAPPLRRCH